MVTSKDGSQNPTESAHIRWAQFGSCMDNAYIQYICTGYTRGIFNTIEGHQVTPDPLRQGVNKPASMSIFYESVIFCERDIWYMYLYGMDLTVFDGLIIITLLPNHVIFSGVGQNYFKVRKRWHY